MTEMTTDQGSISVAAVGGFHVAGHRVRTGSAEEDGYAEGQTYVQYTRLAAPRARFPLLALHGGGLTGACFGDTPDGRPGWQWRFLVAGFDVFVADGVGAGRSGWRTRPAGPLLRDKATLWELFRIGPPGSYGSGHLCHRQAYGDSRFPVASFNEFVNQVVPVNRDDPKLRQCGYDELVKRIGPCLLLSHSAAGPYGERSALAAPHAIRAHVAIEPSGAPDPESIDIELLCAVPHLFVWGDHLHDAAWQREYQSSRRFHDALVEAGGSSEWIDLPALGVHGNSHLIMMDENSDEVAALVCDWLRRQGFVD